MPESILCATIPFDARLRVTTRPMTVPHRRIGSRFRWSAGFGGLPIFTPRNLARLSCHIGRRLTRSDVTEDGRADQKLKR